MKINIPNSAIITCLLFLFGCSTLYIPNEIKNTNSNTVKYEFTATYISIYRWGDNPVWPDVIKCGTGAPIKKFSLKRSRDGAKVRTYSCIQKTQLG